MRAALVLDATRGDVARQARTLRAFAARGLHGIEAAESLVLLDERGDTATLVDVSPTPAVRLVRTPPRRADVAADGLASLAPQTGAALFLFAGGPGGTELAARLARRVRGCVLTDALELSGSAEGLACRRAAYSNHLIGHYRLPAGRLACVTVDASWSDTGAAAASSAPGPCARGGLEVLSETPAPTTSSVGPFECVEPLDASPAAGLTESRFLVVVGRGAGSRRGVERLAAAARRMGADLGVSRPVAMNGWAPAGLTVGVSGARAAPDLCLVAAASGAPALVWGVERAAFLVAVNTDDHAPIAHEADAVVVDDAATVLEALADMVEEHGAGARP